MNGKYTKKYVGIFSWFEICVEWYVRVCVCVLV